jgi:hypothetical protein
MEPMKKRLSIALALTTALLLFNILVIMSGYGSGFYPEL